MPQAQDSLCVDPRVDPLLGELHAPVAMHLAGRYCRRRGELEAFIARVFAKTCGARVTRFFPDLLAFSCEGDVNAVVGIRGASSSQLFLEQYLDVPAERAISERAARPVNRTGVVEVGNLALQSPGQARWIIAATTAFLAAARFRWVIFTAAAPLVNAFRRLGLRPIRVARADAARLPDRGASWGRYYDAVPLVYAGDVQAGARKLRQARCWQHDRLRELLVRAQVLGAGIPLTSRAAGRAGQ